MIMKDICSTAQAVVDLLKSRGQTLATAESCTGGLVASGLVSVPGCSSVFREGLVTYSNESKIARLDVDPELIKTNGAVSVEVAAAMASGVAKTSGTMIGLATTGIAGPDGGTPEKPIGLVCIGLYAPENNTITAKHNLSGTRDEIRSQAAKLALEMVLAMQ